MTALPRYVSQIAQVGASIERIADFLAEDEVPDFISSLKRGIVERAAEPEILGLERASFKWGSSTSTEPNTQTGNQTPTSESSQTFELRDVSVIFPTGRLSIIAGATASGKTALLMALLGEMTSTTESSVIHLPKNITQVDEWGLRNAVSFAAQSPWLQNMSIR